MHLTAQQEHHDTSAFTLFDSVDATGRTSTFTCRRTHPQSADVWHGADDSSGNKNTIDRLLILYNFLFFKCLKNFNQKKLKLEFSKTLKCFTWKMTWAVKCCSSVNLILYICLDVLDINWKTVANWVQYLFNCLYSCYSMFQFILGYVGVLFHTLR